MIAVCGSVVVGGGEAIGSCAVPSVVAAGELCGSASEELVDEQGAVWPVCSGSWYCEGILTALLPTKKTSKMKIITFPIANDLDIFNGPMIDKRKMKIACSGRSCLQLFLVLNGNL